MTECDPLEIVGYCGLACGMCVNACVPRCREGGGPVDCYQRECCSRKGLDGCWLCDEFPCNNGFFEDGDDPAFRGICIGSVQCIKDCGLERYIELAAAKLGPVIEYGDHRYLDPEGVRRTLCDGT
jgi:hypothetical protein